MNDYQSMDIRPYQLPCLICRQGCRTSAERYGHTDRLDEIQRGVAADPIVPLTLRCNTRTVFQFQNPGRQYDTPEGENYNDLRDLTILRRLGAVPGATLPAVDWFQRIFRLIPSTQGICAYPADQAPTWPRCRLADSGNYERGLAGGLESILPVRNAAQLRKAKAETAADCLCAERLRIRPHHLLCMSCFHAGRAREDLKPIDADNVWECIDVIHRNPETPIELIHGPCMLCPSCGSYHDAANLCIGGNCMGLRDDKKDLDTLRRLGLAYGDVLPARELLRKLYAAIATTTEICGHGDGVESSQEWRVCGGSNGHAGYEQARRAGLGIPGVAPENL